VHNFAAYGVQMVLAEVFSMGIKAGSEPLALWEAVRTGASAGQRTLDRLYDRFLPNKYDSPSFALQLGHKDMRLATEL
jgi:3-hydroxyisobutyrate dehydrogenase